jgi:glucokinase
MAAAIDRFCLSLGSAAGDLALAQGGSSVVIAGGLACASRTRSSPPALPKDPAPRAALKA